jgi:hypothetical protein
LLKEPGFIIICRAKQPNFLLAHGERELMKKQFYNYLNKIAFQAFLLVACLFVTTSSFAGGNSGTQTIKQIRVDAAGTVFLYGTTGNWNNPDACNKSDFIVLLPEPMGTLNPYYSEMYALAVASFLQGKSINGWLSGCSTLFTDTRPILRNINSL